MLYRELYISKDRKIIKKEEIEIKANLEKFIKNQAKLNKLKKEEKDLKDYFKKFGNGKIEIEFKDSNYILTVNNFNSTVSSLDEEAISKELGINNLDEFRKYKEITKTLIKIKEK